MNRAIKRVGVAVVVLLLILVGQLSYFQVVDAKRLANDPNNVRTLLKEFNRARGEIQTADGEVVAQSVPTTGGDDFKYQRVYPTGGLFAQITGYQSLLTDNSGVENTYNDVLTGRDKTLDIGNLGGVLSGKQDTQNVVLSLRKNLQQLAADQLEGRRGSVVVLDVKTGGVLAMYSNPTYDPNVLASHDTKAVNDASTLYNLDPLKPTLPRAYAEIFPPGSTFKTVTSIASIDAGISTPDRSFPLLSELKLPQSTQPLKNFGGGTCGGTMTVALVNSCNVVFAQLGLELGNDFVPRMANCGVEAGNPPPLDLANPGAAASVGPPAGSFDNDKPSFARAGIGQDPVATTPLEMAMVAAAIGNGGTMMVPHVAQQITDSDGKVLRDLAPETWKTCTSPATARTVADMMVQVVQRGTGVAAQITGVTVAGKSGTAQTDIEGKVHAWFVAFAPAENPQYAVSVIIEGDTGVSSEQTGGAVSAPIAGAMLAAALGR
ncbi:MAG: penicillin-binding transpeptidase domain-containing protein [Acidimicrobiia bacterium]